MIVRPNLRLALIACLPSLLALASEGARELDGRMPVERATILACWAFTTVPLVALAILRDGTREGDDARTRAQIERALEAVRTADAVAARHAEALARIETLLAAVPASPAARPARPRARVAWRIGLLLVVVLVVAGGMAHAFQAAPRTVHDHATFAFFVHGELLSFAHTAFDLSQRGRSLGHLHLSDPTVLHIEGPSGATLRELADNALAVQLDPGVTTLDPFVHGSAVLRDGDAGALRLIVAHANGTAWTQVEGPPGDYHPSNGDRLLLTFGTTGPETLVAQERAVAFLPFG